MIDQDSRPIYLNLFKIHLPITGLVSILHRISGLLLVFATPLLLYLFQLSLKDEAGFMAVQSWLHSPLGYLLLILIGWALFHHLFAGLRHLALDIDLGLQRSTARRTAWTVMIVTLLALLGLLGGLWQ